MNNTNPSQQKPSKISLIILILLLVWSFFFILNTIDFLSIPFLPKEYTTDFLEVLMTHSIVLSIGIIVSLIIRKKFQSKYAVVNDTFWVFIYILQFFILL